MAGLKMNKSTRARGGYYCIMLWVVLMTMYVGKAEGYICLWDCIDNCKEGGPECWANCYNGCLQDQPLLEEKIPVVPSPKMPRMDNSLAQGPSTNKGYHHQIKPQSTRAAINDASNRKLLST